MIDDTLLSSLTANIEKTPPRPHHSALLEIANRIKPGCVFHYALNRGGWYRPGGVIAPDGTRLAASVEAWAGESDIGDLLDSYGDSGLLVTRHTGRTHYFVASYGAAPADFLQLEVEELQEVLDRKLIDDAHPPEDLHDLIEPVLPALLEGEPVGAPYYRLSRLIDMRRSVARAMQVDAARTVLSRLFTEWTHSSAAASHFSAHWIVSLREHLDRYKNPVISVSPVSVHARELKSFQWNSELAGPDMSAQLQAFDRAAGYPAAWYFHLVIGTITPPKVAYAVARDLEEGYCYLPDSEIALIKGWVAAPYSV